MTKYEENDIASTFLHHEPTKRLEEEDMLDYSLMPMNY